MMEKQNTKISVNQGFSIITCFTIGAGVISISRTSVSIVRDLVWLPILVIGLIHIIEAYWMTIIIKRYQCKDSLDLLQQIIGKIPAKVVLFLYLVVFLAILSLELVVLLDLTASTITPSTPQWFVLGSFLLVVYFLVSKGLTVMARLFELLVPIILFLIFFIIILAAFNINLLNLHPADMTLRSDAFSSIIGVFFAYSGPIYVIFIYPYLAHAKKIVQATMYSNLIVIGTYLSIGLVTVGVFGAGEVEHLQWPSLELAKVVNTQGVFIHRLDFIYVVLWIVTIFTTVASIFYACVRILKLLFKIKKKYSEAFIAIIISFAAYQLYDIEIKEKLALISGCALVLLGLVIPIMFSIGVLIRSRLTHKEAEDGS